MMKIAPTWRRTGEGGRRAKLLRLIQTLAEQNGTGKANFPEGPHAVTVCQFNPDEDTLDQALDRLSEYLVKHGSDFLLLPEMCFAP